MLQPLGLTTGVSAPLSRSIASEPRRFIGTSMRSRSTEPASCRCHGGLARTCRPENGPGQSGRSTSSP
jgi:hypothetical protein